jgi:hypothetical protein
MEEMLQILLLTPEAKRLSVFSEQWRGHRCRDGWFFGTSAKGNATRLWGSTPDFPWCKKTALLVENCVAHTFEGLK